MQKEERLLKAVEDISSTKKRLKIEVPAEAIESEIKKKLHTAQRLANIPGFRQGKAPMHLIEKRFIKEIEADVLEEIIPEYYLKAIEEADIIPVSMPVVEESFDFKRNEPITMTVLVEVRPKVENLNYDGLSVSEIRVEVSDEEIDAALSRLAEERATYEPVEGTVIDGDLVTIDYTAQHGDEPPVCVEDVIVRVSSDRYPQEFCNGLIGRKIDEEFIIEASFPEDSWTRFAGKRPRFEVRIKDIKRRNTPAIDDELAKDLGVDDIRQLREKVKEDIIALKSREAERIQQGEILDKLVESHSFDVPEALLNAEISRMIDEVRVAGNDERTDEEIREEIRPLAEKRIKASILLELIGEKEGVSVSDEEMKEKIMDIAQRLYVSAEDVIRYFTEEDGSLEGIRWFVFKKKVLNLLLNKAKIERGE